MKKKTIIVLFISLILDQITKILAAHLLVLEQSKVIIKNFFHLTLCHNTGVAWSLLDNKRLLIIIITLIAIIVLIKYMHSFKDNTRNNIAFGLLFGGLLGNLIDRVFYGYVIDFIDIYIFKYDYPIFNIADTFIVIAIILLIISIIKGDDENEPTSRKGRKTRQVSSE